MQQKYDKKHGYVSVRMSDKVSTLFRAPQMMWQGHFAFGFATLQ